MEATISAVTENSSKFNSIGIKIDWLLVLEYVKVIIWPVIISGFLFYFKNNIRGLIDRITIIKGPGGTEIRAEQERKIEKQEEGIEKISDENIKKDLQVQIEEVKKTYEEELSKEKKANTNKDKIISNLLEQLSFKSLQLEFEQIYRLIFGSQIDLLKRLRLASSGEASKNTIIFFAFIQRLFAVFTSWTFSQYINFLLSSGFIYFNNDHYFITDKGKAFLNYIEILNYPRKDL